MAAIGPLSDLAQGVRLRIQDTQMLGDDLRILARVAGRDSFLP